jgi:outer membrane protein W
MRRALSVVALGLLLAPAAPRAQVAVGLRLGYAFSQGDIAKGAPMSDETESQVPIQIDLTYRVTDRISAGAYGSYGFARLDSALCPSGVSCTANVVRVGVEAFYAFESPGQRLSPWVGAGIGWERSYASQQGGGRRDEAIYSGLELLNLQVGADYRLAERVQAGPFVMMSVGRYSRLDVRTSAARISGSIDDPAFHEWFALGIRGRFEL